MDEQINGLLIKVCLSLNVLGVGICKGPIPPLLGSRGRNKINVQRKGFVSKEIGVIIPLLSGPTFRLIADSLDVARASRRSPWEILANEGERIGIEELPELAATVKLGGEQGARMTASLVAKASSMRAKQLAEVEADANTATERMGLPMVLLFMGFLVLLGYPAMQMISAGFGS